MAGASARSWKTTLPARVRRPGRAARGSRKSIDILLEEKQVYFQQPTAYYFPGLPQIQFYERARFRLGPGVEAAAGDMRTELETVAARRWPVPALSPGGKDRPRYDFHGLLDNPAWSTLYLWENGGPVEANVARFPKTFAALQRRCPWRTSPRARPPSCSRC